MSQILGCLAGAVWGALSVSRMGELLRCRNLGVAGQNSGSARVQIRDFGELRECLKVCCRTPLGCLDGVGCQSSCRRVSGNLVGGGKFWFPECLGGG